MRGERPPILFGWPRIPATARFSRERPPHCFSSRNGCAGTDFSEFEGLLNNPAAARELTVKYGPEYRYSPSQLETYIACPFQFFCKYVLELEPIEEKDELDEDLTVRGSRIHDILEELENRLKVIDPALDHDSAMLAVVEDNFGKALALPTDLGLGLREIEQGRLTRAMRQYLEQRIAYERQSEITFRPFKLELDFGKEGTDYPVLEMSEGDRTIRLRGRIDRIDVAETPEGLRFRVIDYKSGSAPSSTDVRRGEMLQLPLYAMAVERLLFQNGAAGLFDLGYWTLKKDGFKAISFGSWDDDQKALVSHVLDLVEELRRGVFVVQSRMPNCESYCEYRNVCRVGQVRRTEKILDRNLLELSVQARRRQESGGDEAGGRSGGTMTEKAKGGVP